MAFDQVTRNRLQRFVTDGRLALEEEFTRQLQNDFGMDPIAGTVTPIESLRHINDQQRETARILRDTLDHYCAAGDMDKKAGLDRIVREQAFTVLNRLAALRMAEARGLLIETVGNGFQAKGFQLYARLAGTGLGETGDAYRVYLQSVFDELSLDLPGLFARYSPQGRLFPREAALLQVLALINHGEIEPLWAEDETIGWIYQYFNSKEERKAMRDASQAPRNSRELAVRNQFFTPRYVVEFLVDNTLGRVWFNWTGGQTGLRDRCQYLLVKPDEQPAPAKRLRDPRTIKLLDPACGSMHFGLYAFDLFLEIYREAWAWEQTHGSGCLDTETGGSADLKPLSQTYADQDAFLQEVPRLIIEHNIYGVDIDPRAAQIASLALWLRAQRAWHQAGVKAKDRSQVGRGHVVAAVAPPAEVDLRKRFMQELDPLDAELFEKTLFLLKGLPELGVLLQVEKELPALVRAIFGEHGDLFREEDMAQWQKAEARVRDALTEFARAARSTYQGRLFADDALQGLRLVDLGNVRFDVAVMNPPFGQPASNQKPYLQEAYPSSWKDLYATFIDRGLELLGEGGYLGAITSSTYLNLANFEDLRVRLINEADLASIVELGNGVMDDAAVSAACICMGVGSRNHLAQRSGFIDIKSPRNKAEILLEASISYRSDQPNSHLFEADPKRFLSMPNSVFSYWVPESLYQVFSENRPISKICRISVGLHTRGNEDRFYRRWWEPTAAQNFSSDWPHIKTGGNPQHYLKNDHIVVNWKKGCAELRSIAESATGGTFTGHESYFKKGISYIYTGQTTFSAQLMQEGGIFSIAAHGLVPNDEGSTFWLLSFLNSEPVRLLLKVINPNRFFQANYVKLLPVPNLSCDEKERLSDIARKSLLLSLEFVSGDECSRYFVKHWCLDFASESDPIKAAVSHAEAISKSLRSQKLAADIIVQASYGTSYKDLKALQVRVGASTAQKLPGDMLVLKERERYVAATLISLLVGCAFGRWNDSSSPQKPRDICGIDLDAAPNLNEALSASGQNRTVDLLSGESSGTDSLVSLVHRALTLIFGENSENTEEAVLSYLQAQDLDAYVNSQSGFFPDHLKKYTEGGSPAPIYWPLSTNSGSYTLWVYYPSLTDQTLFTAVNDFIDPKLKQVGQDVTALRTKGSARSRDDEKTFEALQTIELELIELRDTLLAIANTYRPNHDDGVQITAAPLWQLFRHKPWQKILKDTWTKLEKGDYDWAHLAMAYWPTRVREKCKTDKSLAIAHNLEHLYVEPEPKTAKARGRKKDAE
jgi:hypothetical protein